MDGGAVHQCIAASGAQKKTEGALLHPQLRSLADDDTMTRHAATIARTLNQFLVQRGDEEIRHPGEHRLLYRGGALPPEHQWFYSGKKWYHLWSRNPGTRRKYRAPPFLSTTDSEATARRFARERGGEHPVLWRLHLPEQRCVHVKDLQHITLAPGPPENEWLFPPYSVFRVISFQDRKRDRDGFYVVDLEVYPDNLFDVRLGRRHESKLPLAPWC